MATSAKSKTIGKPKLLGAIETLQKSRHAESEQLQQAQVTAPIEVVMNWQGRYKPLDRSSPAFQFSTINNPREDDSSYQLTKVLNRANQQGLSPDSQDLTLSKSQIHQEHQAMMILFGDEITPHHINIFNSLKKLVAKWRARAAQRKNVIAVEQFASDDIQKRALLMHRERSIVELPMPIMRAVREEALVILQGVIKVYRKEFGNKHKLTIDAKKRIDKLTAELAR